MGIKVALLGKIGKDALGDYIIKTCNNTNVDTLGLKLDQITTTSGTIVAIDNKGERTLMHYLGTNGTLCFEDIELSYLDKTKILFIGGTFLMPSFDGKDATKILKLAKSKGVLCAMDTAWDAYGCWMGKIEQSLQYLDWFMPSYEEAVELSKEREFEKISQIFFGKGVNNVVIKLGAEGCYISEKCGQKNYHVAPLKNIIVKDTSGAGDAFCAGFLTGLIKGWEIKKCAEFGNAVGALCVTEIGTISAARSFEKILEFKQAHQ